MKAVLQEGGGVRVRAMEVNGQTGRRGEDSPSATLGLITEKPEEPEDPEPPEEASFSLVLSPGDSLVLDSVVSTLHNISFHLWAVLPGRLVTGRGQDGGELLSLSVGEGGQLEVDLGEQRLVVEAWLLGRSSHVVVEVVRGGRAVQVVVDQNTSAVVAVPRVWPEQALAEIVLGAGQGQGVVGCLGSLKLGGVAVLPDSEDILASISLPGQASSQCGPLVGATSSTVLQEAVHRVRDTGTDLLSSTDLLSVNYLVLMVLLTTLLLVAVLIISGVVSNLLTSSLIEQIKLEC